MLSPLTRVAVSEYRVGRNDTADFWDALSLAAIDPEGTASGLNLYLFPGHPVSGQGEGVVDNKGLTREPNPGIADLVSDPDEVSCTSRSIIPPLAEHKALVTNWRECRGDSLPWHTGFDLAPTP